jgi:hypothetical protein
MILGRTEEKAYPVSLRCNLPSFLHTLHADSFIEGECQLEEAADPSRELDNIVA